jgi:hypothetical protein
MQYSQYYVMIGVSEQSLFESQVSILVHRSPLTHHKAHSTQHTHGF